jgi:hypothetical protein
MAPIRISRHGLRQCPGCSTHVRVTDARAPFVCPFCATSSEASQAGRGLLELAASSRSALVAASLFATTGLGACVGGGGSGGDTAPLDVTDTAGDTAADTAADVEIVEDAINAPEYGMPADVDVEVVEDVINAPEYGMPADVGPAPAYGIPPDADY